MIAAHPAHAPALAALHAACFSPAEAWSAAAFAAQLALPGVFGLLDETGGLVLARVAADEAEILTIAVHPEARRHGLGGRLLAEAMRRAGQAGAVSMFLEVAAGNGAARALYHRAGFRPVGKRRGYYPDGGDALVLRAAVTPGAATGG